MRTNSTLRWVRHRQRAAVLAATVLAATASPTATAEAHPFGPPLTAEVQIDRDRVVVSWNAAEDDWVALGRGVGALDAPAGDVDEGATVPRTGFERIAGSDEVAWYLLDHITVSQGGVACDGEVRFPDEIGTLLGAGVPVTFTCPEDVQQFDLRITAMTDVHEAYRTVSILRPGPHRAIHTLADPTRTLAVSGPRALPFGREDLARAAAIAAVACLALAFSVGRRRPIGVAYRRAADVPGGPATGRTPSDAEAR